MQIIEIPFFNNTIKDYSARMIAESSLKDSLNILFDSNKTRTRFGIQSFREKLNEPVIKVALYTQLYGQKPYVIVFTPRNAYRLDQSSGFYLNITRRFNRGSVTVSGGTLVTLTPETPVVISISIANALNEYNKINLVSVTGIRCGMLITGTNIPAGTRVARINSVEKIVTMTKWTTAKPTGNMTFTSNFDAVRWTRPNTYRIGFGSTNPDEIGTWHTVMWINTNTTLTLASAVANQTHNRFCLKLDYSGNEDNFWQTAYPYDDTIPNGGDKAMLATNGIDYLQIWTGDGAFEDLLTYNGICKHVGYYGQGGAEHIICSNVYDTITGYENSTALEISDSGELEWDDGAVYPLYDSTSPVLGVVPIHDKFFIYKRNTISVAVTNFNDADGTNPFIIEQDLKRNLGTVSIDTVVSIGFMHLFFTGSRIAFFDGYNHDFVDEGIYLFMNRIYNKAYIYRSFAFHFQDRNLYCLAVPVNGSQFCNMVLVYNYVDKNFTFWQMTGEDGTLLNMISKGRYIPEPYIPWSSQIFETTATALASSTITVGNTSGILAGMRAKINGIANELYVQIVINATSLVVGTKIDKTSRNPSDITPFPVTCSGAGAVFGYTALQQKARWIDLLDTGEGERLLLSDRLGNIYEFSSNFEEDITTTVSYPVRAYIETKDYELNKGLTFLFLGLTIRVQLLEGEMGFSPSSLFVSASCDYGRNWTSEQEIQLDGTETFMEKRLGYMMRGKAIRLKIRSERPFVIEGLFLNFNPTGTSKKYDY